MSSLSHLNPFRLRKPFLTRMVLLLPLFMSACQTGRLSLTILEPAKTILPPEIEYVSILPIAGTSGKEAIDSLRYLKPDPSVNNYDILEGYIDGLYSILSLSPRFKRVVISDSVDPTKPIYWEDLRKLCEKDSTRSVLIITKAVSIDNVGIVQTKDEASRDVFELLYVERYYLINKIKACFFNPLLQEKTATVSATDTVIFSNDFTAYEIPYLLYDTYYQIGENLGKRIVPYWMSVDREFFKGPGENLRDAAVFVMKDHWYNAVLLWEELANDKNTSKKKTSRAAYNIALAFERDDDLQQAYLWASYADSMDQNALTVNYKKILEYRLKKLPILEDQMQ